MNTKKLNFKKIASSSLNYIMLAAAAFLILAPLYMVFIIAFKTNKEYLYGGLLDIPNSFLNFENFRKVLDKGNILLGFKNTLTLIIVSVTASIMMGLMVSYVLDRFDFRLKKLIMNAFVISAIIPFITTSIATFSIIKFLHLYNTIFAGILLYVATDIIQIYLFLQYFKKIPKDLDESGMIDGASYVRIFFAILIPQMGPAIATMAIIKALGIYNDIFIPYIYMPGNNLRTVATSLQNFQLLRGTEWTTMSAAILIVLLPTLIVYVFCQNFIISGLTDGAVKG